MFAFTDEESLLYPLFPFFVKGGVVTFLCFVIFNEKVFRDDVLLYIKKSVVKILLWNKLDVKCSVPFHQMAKIIMRL